jgi:thymidylate synthase
LGVPFNIASYAILTHMIAHVCGLKAGDFVHTTGDCHVYLNHVSALEEQLNRTPRPFPTLKINNDSGDIESFKVTDFEIIGYDPYPAVKMEMAV